MTPAVMERPLARVPTSKLEVEVRKVGAPFINEQQQAFFDCTAPEVLYSGAVRAGKSRIGCEKAYWLAKRYPGIPIGIFRKEAASLAASTLDTFLRHVVPSREIVDSNKTRGWYQLFNGSEFHFMGLETDSITQTPLKVGSVELGWAFIDEAAQVTEDDWNFVKTRLSWPGIPYHQLAGATNPAAPGHWLKRRFTPPSPTRVFIHARTSDNPALPRDFVGELALEVDSFRKKRLFYGEWVAAEGQIWHLPDGQVRSVPEQKWRRVVAGIDWGYQHPFACEVIAETGLGRRAVVAEVYVRGRTLKDIIPDLRRIHAQYGISAFYADPSEPAYIEECQQAGLPVVGAVNDVLPGITAVSQELAEGLLVDPACEGLLGEIPGYVWASDRNGVRDVPVKLHDDACDALRYAVMALRGAVSGDWSMVA